MVDLRGAGAEWRVPDIVPELFDGVEVFFIGTWGGVLPLAVRS